MVEIALLGGVSVDANGAALSGEAAQRRRVALLAVLATPALRPVSRDRLIGLLWPDHDEESARHLLSSALYVLRRALGQDALHTTVDEVALNAAAVRSDVAEFRQALASGETERALALYGGDFMDGFFVNDAVDFTQWLEGERAELRRQYGMALERAGQLRQETGDVLGAADAWRRRAALDPYEPRIALALMHALVAANQRPAAIQHARVHAMLLEQEFGSAPDPQVEALAATLRLQPAAPPPSSPATPAALPAASGSAATAQEVLPARVPEAAALAVTRPAAAAAAPVRHAVPGAGHRSGRRVQWRQLAWRRMLWRRLVPAVLLTAVIASGGVLLAVHEPALKIGVRPFTSPDSTLQMTALGLAGELAGELPRIRGVRVVASDLASRTTDIDSREANLRLGTDHVLNLSLRRQGSLVAYLELVDRSGVNLVTEPRLAAAGLAELKELALERVAATLHRRLRPRSPSTLAADSADTAAVRHYIAGAGAWYERTPASLRVALGEFETAVGIDSSYARGWLGLAQTLALLGSYDYAGLAPREAFPRAETAASRALRLDPSLADAHAAVGLIHMNYYWDWERAETEFQRALDGAAGDRASAREWHALLLAARGRIGDARRETVRAVEDEPARATPLIQRAHILYYAGEYEQARADVQLVLQRDPGFVRAHLLNALIDLQTGREQQALASLLQFRAMSPDPEPALMAMLGCAQARTGDREQARAQLDWLRRAAARGQHVPPELRAVVHVALGERDAALDELERAYREKSGGLVYLEVEPLVADLRTEPRFRKLAELLRLPPARRPQ